MRTISPRSALSAALAAALLPVALFAQDSSQQSAAATSAQQSAQAAPPAPDRPHHHHRHNPKRQAEKLASTLNLTQDQESRIEPIFASRREQMHALRADSSLTPQERHVKARSIVADTQGQIAQVLTPEQNQQWQQIRQQRHMQKHEQHAGQPDVSPAAGSEATAGQ